MDRKLGRPVTVEGVTYMPGDHLPAKVAAKIKNPKAWIPLDEDQSGDQDTGPAGTRSGDRLATTVMVGGKSYGPNDFVPDHIAAQIRNPKAWQGGELPELDDDEPDDEIDNGPAGGAGISGGSSGGGQDGELLPPSGPVEPPASGDEGTQDAGGSDGGSGGSQDSGPAGEPPAPQPTLPPVPPEAVPEEKTRGGKKANK